MTDWLTLGKLLWFGLGCLVGYVAALSMVFLMVEPKAGPR